MDEQEIVEIVAEGWLGRPSANEAAVTAYSEIGKRILGKLIGHIKRFVNQRDWETLLQMNEAGSRMCYFRQLGPANITDEFQTASLFFLFDAWESALQYLCAHCDDAGPEAEELRRAGSSKERLEEIRGQVAALVHAHFSKLTESGQVFIPIEEFEMMERTFGPVSLLILGREGLKTFISEFNGTLPILKRTLGELSLQSRKTKLSSDKAPILFRPRKNRTVN